MDRSTLRWAVLLGVLILVPAAILTWLSARAFRDDGDSVLADLRPLVPAMQRALERNLSRIWQTALADSALDVPGTDSIPGLAAVAILDSNGVFLRPAVRPLRLTQRHPEFARLFDQGSALEFGTGDPAAASRVYAAALQAARAPGERAEALDALGRCALAADDTAAARGFLHRLQLYGLVLDPDGAHSLSLSVLRLARHFRRALLDGPQPPPPPQLRRFTQLVGNWARGVLSGQLAVTAATGLIARELRHEARRALAGSDALEPLVHMLDRVDHATGLVAAYGGLYAAGPAPIGHYLSGVGTDGSSHLVVLIPREDGRRLGLACDLDHLSASLAQTPAGHQVQALGLRWELLDLDGLADFHDRHGANASLAVPALASGLRLQLGFYAADLGLLLSGYRRRNLLILSAIGLLAATIATGVFLLARDTAREHQAARLRADFIANVSHELRTPLTSIRLYAETLLLDRVRNHAQRREYLRTMMRESQRLTRMVGNILDFSRLENGRKTYEFQDCDLGIVARQVMDEFAPLLEERGFTWTLRVADGLPQVRADHQALESALANLIGNAIKYSREHRELLVDVRCRRGYCCVDVADRGIGVPPEEVSRIFQKFQRAGNAASAATGTGLGLALVKSVATAHDGHVVALPRAGGGTHFRLCIPILTPDGGIPA